MAAAAVAEDRLSGLPDDLLHSILRGLPLKQGARTSALSRRWAHQWLHALAFSAVIDLTDRDFARGHPPMRAAATVSRCLTLHTEYDAPLHVFGVVLGSGRDASAFGRDVAEWVAATVARGARDVEVDLTRRQEDPADNNHGCSAFMVELPGDLFLARNSLEQLALGG
uniref:F-box domain-containing protein n=1 Tax=Setaria italica TaxID=4555 RepID=K3XS47_SETIT